jgi:NAD dependent epimerase/dehydratase family enzyme
MGVETLLSDLHVEPMAAVKAGFRFATPTLDTALPLALGE